MNSDIAHYIAQHEQRRWERGVLVGTAFDDVQMRASNYAFDRMKDEMASACKPHVYDPIMCEQSAMAWLKIGCEILTARDWRRP